MPTQLNFHFQCRSSEHVHERKLTRDEKEALPRIDGTSFVSCPECGEPALQMFCSGPIKYDAPGFYGNLGTAVASNVHLV